MPNRATAPTLYLWSIVVASISPISIRNSRRKASRYRLGYGKVKDSSFRIGHMGDPTVKDMNDLVHVMDEGMEGMQ